MPNFDALMPLRLSVINISRNSDLRPDKDGPTVALNIPHCTKTRDEGEVSGKEPHQLREGETSRGSLNDVSYQIQNVPVAGDFFGCVDHPGGACDGARGRAVGNR